MPALPGRVGRGAAAAGLGEGGTSMACRAGEGAAKNGGRRTA